MGMKKRVYGVLGISSIMANWNAGFDGYPKLKPFTRRNVHLHIGKPISYKLSTEEIIYEWCRQISEHADYKNVAPVPNSDRKEVSV